MKSSNSKEQVELDTIKTGLADFDLAIPGTLRRIFLKCGKSACACQKDKAARHGPYFLWDRKVGKKLTSISVDVDEIPRIKRWITNRKNLEKQISKVLALSQAMATAQIEKAREKRKQIKSATLKE